MDAPHRNDAAGGVTLTLTPDAHDLTRRALLADTVELAESLAEQLAGLRDQADPEWIDVADARTSARLLRANLDALAALGWPEGRRP